MDSKIVKRITKNAIMLAILCIIGMFSLPLGDNIKVSLQLLVVFIVALTASSVLDAMCVTGLYLLLGLFMPIYAGFSVGITPTFGFVISFVVLVVPVYFINKINIKNQFLRMGIACFIGLIVCYIIGTAFLYLYLKYALNMNIGIEKALLIAVVPYIPFDIAKIVIATLVVSLLPSKYTH